MEARFCRCLFFRKLACFVICRPCVFSLLRNHPAFPKTCSSTLRHVYLYRLSASPATDRALLTAHTLADLATRLAAGFVVVLICISPMTNEGHHLSMPSLAICMSLSAKHPFKAFTHFSNVVISLPSTGNKSFIYPG